jgi:hypothetical protein
MKGLKSYLRSIEAFCERQMDVRGCFEGSTCVEDRLQTINLV